MIISKVNKYIYIACPKTATTSIQNFLLDQDHTSSRNEIVLNSRMIKFSDHDTTASVKVKLGDEFDEFKIICFMRHPYSKILSSYFFLKKSGKKELINPFKRNFRKLSFNKKLIRCANSLKFLSAKFLPFKLWAILYPYKSNMKYFLDEKNNIIVSFVGTYENLNFDLEYFFKGLNLNFDYSKLKKMNVSKHAHYEKYFENSLFRTIINLKCNKDLKFYSTQKVKNNARI